MNVRETILAHNFGDLDTDVRRMEFVQLLLESNNHSRIEILNDQFNIDAANLDTLLVFLLGKEELAGNPVYDRITMEISLVLATPNLHQREFIKLDSPEHRTQFVMGLLMLDVLNRNTMLAQQLTLNPQNIEHLHTVLTSDARELFQRFPCYESLLSAVLRFKESLKAPPAPPVLQKQQPAPTVAPLIPTASPSVKIEPAASATAQTKGGPQSFSLAEELLELCDAHLNDPVNLETFEAPVITPLGITHTDSAIRQCLLLRNEEPVTRAPLKTSDLMPNHTVTAFVGRLKNNNINLANLRNLFTCPLAGEVFNDPVVAADGITYERAYIEAYLEEHKNRPPLFANADNRLYPNLFIKSLLGLARIQDLLASCQTPLEKKNAALIQSFRDYQQTRLQEGNYPWFFFSYRKMQKIGIAVDAKRVLSGKMTPLTFFSRHDHDLSALTRGRLGLTGNPALSEIENMRKPR